MSVEIEAKMRLDDIAPLISRLSALGAKPGRDVVELNKYFDTSHGQLRSQDRGLRVRLEEEVEGSWRTATMTHKGPRAAGELKIRTETQIVVSDVDAATDLLCALGFLVVRSFQKRRRVWALDGCEVDIDTLPYLGHFVEIEGPSEQAVLAVRQTLGLESNPLVSGSYISMLEAYIAEHQIATDCIRLAHHQKRD